LERVPSRLWQGCGAEGCQCPACGAHRHFVGVLKLYAARAAFLSLCHWATAGTTGDNTGGGDGGPFGARASGVALIELTGDAGGAYGVVLPLIDERIPSQDAARWRLARWVFQIGLRQYCETHAGGKGAGQIRAAARRRCRVVGLVIFGATLADACAMAGFQSVAAWGESCKAARVRAVNALESVQLARGEQRAYAIDAGDIAKQLQALGSAGAWCDTVDTSTQRARRVGAPGKAAAVLARRALVRELAFNVERAVYWKQRAAALVRDNLASFDRVLAGVHSERFGDLQRLFGHVDKRGRARSRSAAGVNPAFIGRARGKLARRTALARAVAVKVNLRGAERNLAGAPAVGGINPRGQDGAAGFVVVHPAR
jgi:hypothetical protein